MGNYSTKYIRWCFGFCSLARSFLRYGEKIKACNISILGFGYGIVRYGLGIGDVSGIR
jgi:hypothetical protein